MHFAWHSFINATQCIRHEHAVTRALCKLHKYRATPHSVFRLHTSCLARLANIGLHLALASQLLITGWTKQTAVHNGPNLLVLCWQPEKVSSVYCRLQKRRRVFQRQHNEEHEGQCCHHSWEQRAGWRCCASLEQHVHDLRCMTRGSWHCLEDPPSGPPVSLRPV